MSPPPITDYELLRVVGQGSYGEVWLARNAVGSMVAVKIVHRARFAHDRPFEREFEVIQRFEPISRTDPSQVPILHVGRGEGFFYYVMELADQADNEKEKRKKGAEEKTLNPGSPPPPFSLSPLLPFSPASYVPHTLKHDLRTHGALPLAECVQIALSLTRALAHLHGHGLVHRDVKPSNVIFVKGLAKLADIGLVTSVDATRSFVGTEGYLPAEGAGTPQADLYSLGKMLYEMATGLDRKEFPALPPDIARRPDRDAVAELDAIIVRACAPDPRKRYPSVAEMGGDLELLHLGKSVKRKQTLQQRWAILKKAGLTAALVALAVIIVSRLMRGGADEYDQSSDSEVNKLVDQGSFAWREGTPKRMRYAAECYQKALQRDPNSAPALFGSAQSFLYDRANFRALTEKLKKIAPNSAETWQCVAFDEWSAGRFPQALADIKRATRKRAACRDGRVWAFGAYRCFLQNMGNAGSALQQHRLPEKITWTDPTILDHLGQTYFMRSNLVEASSIRWDPLQLHALLWNGDPAKTSEVWKPIA